jgi:hypothetical protein
VGLVNIDQNLGTRLGRDVRLRLRLRGRSIGFGLLSRGIGGLGLGAWLIAAILGGLRLGVWSHGVMV